MIQANNHTPVMAPREGVNDDFVQLIEWLLPDGAPVCEKQAIVVLQTAKATFEMEAPASGFLFHSAGEGSDVPVGTPIAWISECAERPKVNGGGVVGPAPEADSAPIITEKAQALLQKYGLSPTVFAGVPVVRAENVEDYLRNRGQTAAEPVARLFAGEELDPTSDWDVVFTRDAYVEMKDVLTALRRRMKAKFNRQVSTGTLLHDRRDVAREYGFGEGTTVYDECLILGDVQVGRDCWIGPYTILDGNHAKLEIGDCVDVGAGTHIYTHNTIERALTGRRAHVMASPTKIGNCCFIAPQTLIAPGAVLGDHCFVAAGSYVEGVFPSFSWVAGNPARPVGVVELQGDRARLVRLKNSQ
jgi:acetyltransferase-like isoleucine patch superfamily enzyme